MHAASPFATQIPKRWQQIRPWYTEIPSLLFHLQTQQKDSKVAQTVRTAITARIPEWVTNLFLLITRNCVTETSMVLQVSRPWKKVTRIQKTWSSANLSHSPSTVCGQLGNKGPHLPVMEGRTILWVSLERLEWFSMATWYTQYRVKTEGCAYQWLYILNKSHQLILLHETLLWFGSPKTCLG